MTQRPNPECQPIATCSCGKFAYTSKGAAKKAGKTLHPDAKMRVYKCHDTRWWHLTSWSAARTTQMRDWRAS